MKVAVPGEYLNGLGHLCVAAREATGSDVIAVVVVFRDGWTDTHTRIFQRGMWRARILLHSKLIVCAFGALFGRVGTVHQV